eukprot:1911021-Prymnesium_polylepis.2
MEDSYKKFTDTRCAKQNEDLKPQVKAVCMGRVFPYTNYKHSMSTRELNAAIDSDFWTMKPSEHRSHPLCDFYKPRANSPIMIRCKNSKSMQRLGSVDHVLPQSWSFLEHPRFYIYVHPGQLAHELARAARVPHCQWPDAPRDPRDETRGGARTGLRIGLRGGAGST